MDTAANQTRRYPHYEFYKKRVDDIIQYYIRESTEDTFKPLIEYALQGGKRIRSSIALSLIDSRLKAQIANASEQIETRNAIAAIEMTCLATELLHSASLILDDLPCMDDDHTRRGLPCFHAKFGIATSILTTCHLFTESIRLCCKAYFAINTLKLTCLDNIIKFIEIISTSIGFNGACGGQFMDLQGIEASSSSSSASSSELRKVLLQKTSSFFRIAILGAYLITESRPVSTEDLKKLENMSDLLGIVFQTYDDFDDLIEDEGKFNCVLDEGAEESYKKFISNMKDVEKCLKEMNLDAEVIHDVELVMKCHIEEMMRMNLQ